MANSGALVDERIRVRGKFFYRGAEKLFIRGVTYGTFSPDASGEHYPRHETVERDFELMSLSGINAIRTYTPPPRWLLDLAHRYEISVMVGVPWPQHLMFLDDRAIVRSIDDAVRTTVARCAGHPALLAFAIGNEIPASIVRWYGRRRIERFLGRLQRIARRADPVTPITYVNFPTTEYLRLPFLDFVAFNVYLESREKLSSYIARLQNIAGDRPLCMAEIGLDSRRNGVDMQAETLSWQVQTAFTEGCAGSFVFAWTDEWHRGGFDIDDWDFGLTTRDREPKPALNAVSRAFRHAPARLDAPPLISVVVCSYNGARTIGECLDGIARLRYPNYEVVVVDDGSRDDTAAIAAKYDVRLISTTNCGLSSARNTGWQAARGEIVAYIDDDASPDPDWLTYLALGYRSGNFGGMGGPNIQPIEDHPIAHCVASAPGGPIHVLLDDRVAEHIPGCNMSFRRSVLEEIGGFDTRFRIAGDDVDVCWRVQQAGHVIGFHAAAMVWHHRRNKVAIYWKQQLNYGRAEAMLEQKWPEKYNRAGHASWHGRLYGDGHRQFLGWRRGRVYQGVWGGAPFQHEDAPEQSIAGALPLMPEWHLVIGALTVISLLGFAWAPLFAAIPLAIAAIVVVLVDAVIGGMRAKLPHHATSRLKLRAITSLLFFLQPLARLVGRSGFGLTPWRRTASPVLAPVRRELTLWSELWHEPSEWIARVAAGIRSLGGVSTSGGPYDQWDLNVRGGLLGGARLLVGIEEHGAGRQQIRVAIRPQVSRALLAVAALFAAIAIAASLDAISVTVIMSVAVVAMITAALTQSGAAIGQTRAALSSISLELVDELERHTQASVQNAIADTHDGDLAHREEPAEHESVESTGDARGSR